MASGQIDEVHGHSVLGEKANASIWTGGYEEENRFVISEQTCENAAAPSFVENAGTVPHSVGVECQCPRFHLREELRSTHPDHFDTEENS